MRDDYTILVSTTEDWIMPVNSTMERNPMQYLEDFRFVYEGLGKEVPSPENVEAAMERTENNWRVMQEKQHDH